MTLFWPFSHLFSTDPVFLYGYIISIELNTTDPAVINVLRTILRNSSYPIIVNNRTRINSIDLSTGEKELQCRTWNTALGKYCTRTFSSSKSEPKWLFGCLFTVCSLNNDSYQCTCEEQYRWSCDLCLYHGSCDNITNDTCGCIYGRPDGQYCQPLDSSKLFT